MSKRGSSPGQFRHPSSASFLAGAKDFMQGAQTLKDGRQELPAAFLVGWVLELILKSYIVHGGIKAGDDDSLYTHDVLALWDLAAQGQDFPFAAKPADWGANVSSTHSNFLIRYRPWDINAWNTPGQTHYDELRRMLDAVDAIVVGGSTPAVTLGISVTAQGTFVPGGS